MPASRRLVHGLALGLSLVAVSCLDDGPSGSAEVASSAGLLLRAVADLNAAAEYTIGIRIYYVRGGEQIDLPAEPSRVSLAGGETRREAVLVQLAGCLADPAREGAPTPGCQLNVELRLLDPSGSTLDVQVSRPPSPTVPGQTIEAPAISLSEVASVRIAPIPALRPQETHTASATALGANEQPLAGRAFTWSSSNPAVATVGASGIVTGVAPGTVTITAAAGIRSGQQSVRVIPRVATVAVTAPMPTLVAGTTQTFGIVARDAAGTVLADLDLRNVQWQSSAPAIAEVSSSGTVLGLRNGTAQITATVDGIAGSAPVTVIVEPITITAPGPVIVGGTVALQTQGAVGMLLWSSSDTTIVSVDANGVARGRFPGTATVTVSSAAGQSTSLPVTAQPLATALSRATLESVSQNYSFTLTGFVAYDIDNQPIPGVVPQWSVASGPMSVEFANSVWMATGASSGLGAAALVAREARTGAVLRTDSYTVLRTVSGGESGWDLETLPAPIPMGGSDTLYVGLRDLTGSGQANRILRLSSSGQVALGHPTRIRTNSDGWVLVPITGGNVPVGGPASLAATLSISAEGDSRGPLNIPVTVFRLSPIVESPP